MDATLQYICPDVLLPLHLLQSHIAERSEHSQWEKTTIKGLAVVKEDMSHSHLTNLHMEEKNKKQLLSTGDPAGKNTTKATRVFRVHRSQMAGKNREGSVANCGDEQVLDAVGYYWVLLHGLLLLILKAVFLFFKVKQIKTKTKEQAKEHTKRARINLTTVREKTENCSSLICSNYCKNQCGGLPKSCVHISRLHCSKEGIHAYQQ